MSDELPKKVFSVPPPPTDDIDSEWGGKGADDTGKTATQAAEEGKAPLSDAGPPGAATQLKAELAGQNETAAAPGTPPPAVDDDDADEEDEEVDDDDADDDEADDGVIAHRVAPAKQAAHGGATLPSEDWLPDWAPWAILVLLVLGGVVGGLTGGFGSSKSAGAGAAETSHGSEK
jgi:hypothetical protein